jgi:hypothetical protein
MDFSQSKLTKTEWESIELPITDQEKNILKMIQEGFSNLNVRQNSNPSLLSYMKIEYTPEIEMYLYEKYFDAPIRAIMTKMPKKGGGGKAPAIQLPKTAKFKKPKKIDLLRLSNMDANIQSGAFDKTKIVEFVQLSFCEKAIGSGVGGHPDPFYVYTLLHLKRATIPCLNRYVTEFVNQFLDVLVAADQDRLRRDTFHQSYKILERNPYLLRFEDITLYDHQKQLFRHFQRGAPDEFGCTAPAPSSLVLYTAPTGTGKTMSPLGLCSGGSYKIIYICAARHIGLSLARSAISMNKRVAFAFGCETAADIRLHYYAAVDYTKNYKTGGIFKVDNSNGTKVDIMICNISSYLTAMHYMLAFHKEEDLILYWDEPTISLDVESHPLHELISQNWRENKISRIVLSCATLPEDQEVLEMLHDYHERFGGNFTRITSADCKKTISLMQCGGEGRIFMPHTVFSTHEEVVAAIGQIRKNPSILRYLDVREIVKFVEHVLPILEEADKDRAADLALDVYFSKVENLTMNRLKNYYLDVLEEIPEHLYSSIWSYCTTVLTETHTGTSIHKIQSTDAIGARSARPGAPLHKTVSMASAPTQNPFHGILLTTEDAHTLTDGPTIYMVEDVQKMAKFIFQQTKIPQQVLEDVLKKIESNNVIQQKMDTATKQLDDMLGKELEKDRKVENERFSPEAKRLKESIEVMRMELQSVTLANKYIPNTRPHQSIWHSADQFVENAFIPMVDEFDILKIMELGVEDRMKLLLLLGIGVFDRTADANPSYMEIMKRLAYDQKLFLIIASSDYIYGTNYQLCHGFLGKDLENMTQQKIIQAMGRIGRNHIQQTYTIRFRDESIVRRLFLPIEENLEAVNMSRLLGGSSRIVDP